MTRWFTAAVCGLLVLAVLGAPAAQAQGLPGKTIVLMGSLGRNVGETPWQMLREQLAMRGFPESDIVEFSYAGGSFGPDGAYQPNPGGRCETFSKLSFLALRQLMVQLKQFKPDNQVFLVGHGVGGFVATQALWGVAGQVEDPAIWSNLGGIVSISGPMAGLSPRRAVFEFANAGRLECVDPSMVAWMQEVGEQPDRYAVAEQRGALVTQRLGYKIGSFGNSLDCAYYIASADICPNVSELAGGRGIMLQLLGDERLTMFVKTGTLWREYALTAEVPGDLADNHSAILVHTQPMAEVAEFVMSQSR